MHSDHLVYISDKLPPKPIWRQLISEIYYSIIYLITYFPGILFKLKNHIDGQKTPIILVSGYLGKSWEWRKLRNRLIKKGHPVYIFSHRFQIGDLTNKSIKLEEFLIKKNIKKCIIISHSMGGLITSGLGYKGRDRIKKAISLGTPFQGAPMARFFPISKALWQMRPNSEFMKAAAYGFNTFSNHQSIFAKFDLSMGKSWAARLGRFDDILLPEIGHLNLIMGDLGVECIESLIDTEEEKSGNNNDLDKKDKIKKS